VGVGTFKWEEELSKIGAEVLSSNYLLCGNTSMRQHKYAATRVCGNMSRRVHSLVEREALELEPCSIDEAFLTLPALARENLQRLAGRLRQRVLDWLGLPIRVGIGPTKTLAKNRNPR
jgi:DNA polymerase V